MAPERRIVIKLTTGPWSGLRIIMGTSAQFESTGHEMPVAIPQVLLFGNRRANIGLVRLSKLAYYYQEQQEPTA